MSLPVDKVVMDLRGREMRVLEHKGDVEVFGWEFWERPLSVVSSRLMKASGMYAPTRLMTWSWPVDKR